MTEFSNDLITIVDTEGTSESGWVWSTALIE